MTDLSDKGRAEEAKAAFDEEMHFIAEGRRNKRVGLWFGATVMGLPNDQLDSFAVKVMDADFEEKGSEDVVRFLKAEAARAGKSFDEASVRQKMDSELQAVIAEMAAE